jgi:hypothetical protein
MEAILGRPWHLQVQKKHCDKVGVQAISIVVFSIFVQLELRHEDIHKKLASSCDLRQLRHFIRSMSLC